jgi:hypothetical protein
MNVEKETVENLFKLIDALPAEFQVLTCMTALRRDKAMVTKARGYIKWATANHSLII